ncbi:MAG: aminotransferase class I/II-fold pyridoxal phosphate-dependent enzyme [Bacteroidales bacterium]|nr:aminotransferase class I/II-fold pyridoxal phosphate-dependent enzyme [Bacteroidales bacterium]
MKQIIDLRSDTLTKPGKAMLDYMSSCPVGDDVFSEDPTVNRLEQYAANLFGHEAAIFCPSGTMTNQIAIKIHTRPGDEVICDTTAHVYNYEGGGIAVNSGASTRLLPGKFGQFTAEDVAQNINPDNIHHPVSKLVVIENTSNKGGGSIWNINEIKKIKAVCQQNDLKLHMDGARLFNALVETGEKPHEYGNIFDSISICLSKGLGAPVGSLLIGNAAFIKQARRVRKVLGGGMRQAGYLAGAGIYALENNISRLKEDHNRARILAQELASLSYVDKVLPVSTNIVIFKLTEQISDHLFIKRMDEQGIKLVGFGPQTIRMVTHLYYNDQMLEQTINILKNFSI